MEISKGMYIRYKYYNEQKIGKIDFIKQDELLDESFIGLINDERVLEGNIVKASFNIIDLIEVGDYVNGEKVTSAESVDKNDTDRYLGFGDYDYYIHDNEDIKDIVTKEQFNSMKYVVERDK